MTSLLNALALVAFGQAETSIRCDEVVPQVGGALALSWVRLRVFQQTGWEVPSPRYPAPVAARTFSVIDWLTVQPRWAQARMLSGPQVPPLVSRRLKRSPVPTKTR